VVDRSDEGVGDPLMMDVIVRFSKSSSASLQARDIMILSASRVLQ
jgi:hypothetical protein